MIDDQFEYIIGKQSPFFPIEQKKNMRKIKGNIYFYFLGFEEQGIQKKNKGWFTDLRGSLPNAKNLYKDNEKRYEILEKEWIWIS